MARADVVADDGSKPPLEVLSVHMAVRDQLRKDILTGFFPAGARLQQAELGKYYRVSVTPVREALRDLSSEGLVDFDPYLGAVVHEPTVTELRHIYEIRSALYPMAIESSVARITSDELDSAERLVDEMSGTMTPESWVVHNRRLHRILDGAVANAHLAEILQRLADVSALYVHISDRDDERRPAAHQEHQRLIAAYRRKDAAEATVLTLSHITQTLEHGIRLLARQFDHPDATAQVADEHQADGGT